MEGKKIYGAIIGVMKDVGAVGKSKRNAQQGFTYRGIDDVMNALQPAMIKNGVFVAPEVLEEHREERTTRNGSVMFSVRLTVLYRFYAEDGSCIEAKVVGEAMDSGDKATNKAMSVAYKYACFQVFCIPTEEMADPDSSTPEPVVDKPVSALARVPAAPAATPASGVITEAQGKALASLAAQKGVPLEQIAGRYQKASLRELTEQEYRSACRILEKMAKAG